MSVEIAELPEFKLAGLAFAGPFPMLSAEMPRIWADFLRREAELGGERRLRYGVSLQQHGGIMLECVAAPLDDLNALPAGMLALRIPARRYAIFTHVGPVTAVQASYLDAFRALEDSGLQLDREAPRLERYDSRFIPTVDEAQRAANAYDILLPLA
ncbi:GyrI-like domain-containing protein [Massilia sp. BJB1822]|uniref:GyrI-like domain-containing protein n=1 Tax=Massilia sp. BJB1822 TaxID=2744470 RepID=UPI0015947967|nr:GyrI-like domain-containing protein [Massilia sp. BJB1822]NVD97457.1 GyrI-like domain-containing protein [Massilia sp. BJB1822]